MDARPATLGGWGGRVAHGWGRLGTYTSATYRNAAPNGMKMRLIIQKRRNSGTTTRRGSDSGMRSTESALELGCPKINLQVRSENATVVACYERPG